MINLQKCGIFLVLLLSVFLFFTQQINADTEVCDSWRCGSNESWDEFPCLPDTVSVDCGDGATGYCSGSTNIDCYGIWSCPEATITCNAPPSYGCTDPNALNYHSPPGEACEYPPDPVYGCSSPGAANYNPDPATIDDGSCRWFVNLNFWVTNQIGQPVSGALVEIYADYGNGNFRTTDGGGFANFGVYDNVTIDFDVSHNDCGIVYGAVYSCWGADVSVGLNCTLPVYGCTDPNATNYNPSANVNNGTCSYCNANMGSSCVSAPNACGQTTSAGTIKCNGSCSSEIPANPPGYGNACTGATSAPNICGQTNPGGAGTIQCNGSCSGATGITPPNSSCPANTPTNVTITEPNYCVSGPAVTVGWTYSDPYGSPQSAYQVQIDDQGAFNSINVDSGKVLSGSNAWFSGQGVLVFNTVYHVRARTWNGYDGVSAWRQASVCNGPGCTGGGADSWKTPSYAYPQVDFNWMANGILNNPSPPLNKPVTFTDATVFNGNPNGRRWDWTFGDGGTSTVQNPPDRTYALEGSYYVTLTATDNANQTCVRTKGPLIIQKPIPKWREIAPR